MKNKWQEKGKCPKCGCSILYFEPKHAFLAVDIKTGRVAEPGECLCECNNPDCDAKFRWHPVSGKITRAK